MTKKIFAHMLTAIILFLSVSIPCNAAPEFTSALECQSAILMEASTGMVLYEKNADEALPPASVTKIMTLLLVMEAVDSGKIKLTDMVSVSENAASMGGSQVYLKVGEEMSVEEMIKCVVIASANDCAVALAEFLCGSEEAFVTQMNTRAKELGMENTNFENTNGLDDTVTNHKISARDIAIMSRELLSHELILKYSSTWMDTIRDGTFGLTNTNRLVRFYSGANGLKTGSTSRAKFCISATAKRDGMQLIAVIMAAPTRDIRNNEAKQLLDFGFANYGVYTAEAGTLEPIRVQGGVSDFCPLTYAGYSAVLEKGDISKITKRIEMPESARSPISKGDALGSVIYECDGKELGRVDILAAEAVDAIGFGTLFLRLLKGFCLS
mgnify:FL=1